MGETIGEMDTTNHRYIVRPSVLKGSVKISGAKNSATRLLVASLLTSEKIEITNFPSSIADAQIQIGMLEKLGKKCTVSRDKVTIYEKEEPISNLVWEKRSIRNTLLVLGALVARTGEGSVPLPGGCQIGERKIDLHEMLLKQMGAEVYIEDNILRAKARDGLKGSDIILPIRSTGATENAIICGCLAKGTTRVWNPHKTPEIMDLIKFLRSMGAEINVFGQEYFEIIGGKPLSGTTHFVIPDNKEAITWLIGSVITGGDLEIIDFPYADTEIPLIHLRESGTKYYRSDNSILVRNGKCYPLEISTGSYPSIHSDMQPFFGVYAACANGLSKIIDYRYPDRYGYAEELAKMGMQYKKINNMIEISGGHKLLGCEVRALDLRAGMALVLAGLVAEGETTVSDAWQVERGYDNFVEKLRSVGGKIRYG